MLRAIVEAFRDPFGSLPLTEVMARAERGTLTLAQSERVAQLAAIHAHIEQAGKP